MNCPNCGTENQAGANFCMSCGTPLTRACPNCGHDLPLEAKFCPNCGHQVAASEPEVAQPLLQQYVPKELLAKLEAARDRGDVEGERRVVTMLFCDVQGSTAAAEQLDPEEWHEIMNSVFEHIIPPVYRYEGTVARLMGDAILAFFGAPIAHEDDPLRAVLAGLDILDDIQDHRREVKREWGLDFDLRVGINTGLVVVGEVGSDLRMEYTAMGDAINVAARMEQTAQPGTIQVTSETYRMVAPWIEASGPDDVEVKGKADPIQAYRVVSRKADTASLRGIDGHESPVLGREHEVQTLVQSLDRLKDGVGSIVSLVGEAGLGKSRLIKELHSRFEETIDSGQWHETASLSYETAQPYALFQRLIRGVAAIDQQDSSDAVRSKIAELVSPIDKAQRSQAESVFSALLSASSDTDSQVSGETFKGLLFSTTLALWRQRTSATPTVLVFDDLHWSDPASAEMIVHLLQLTEEAPLLVLCATRPDRESPGWRIREAAEASHGHRFHEHQLRPLSPEDSEVLVDNLLTTAELPENLRTQIQAKAEGNPFFVEEVVRTLLDSGVVVRDDVSGRWVMGDGSVTFEVPDNLQALLVARIDRLDEEARRTIQTASVIGRSFYYRVLQRILDSNGALDAQMVTLQRAALILQSARLPELEYTFRHSLTQEAAYNTVLLRRRRDLHRYVAETLESLFANRQDEMAATLAYHYDQAREFDRAFAFFVKAGDVAFSLFANAEAVDHYDRALQIALHRELDDDLLIHVFVNRGRSLELSNRYDDALDNYRQMIDLSQSRNDPSLELAALTARATVHATQSPKYDPAQAKADSDRALELSRDLGDREAEAKVLWNLLLVHLNGIIDPAKAVEYGEQSLAVAQELGMSEQVAFTLSDLGWAYGGVGRLDRAVALLGEARPLWRELGNLAMLANNLSVSWMTQYMIGDYKRVIELGNEAYEISTSIDNLWGQWSATLPNCYAYLEMGEPGKALEATKQGYDLADTAGLDIQKAFGLAMTSWIYSILGSADLGRDYYLRSMETDVDQLPAFMRSWLMAIVAMFETATGDMSAAQEHAQVAMTDVDLTNFSFPVPPFILLARSRLALAQEDFPLAIEATDEMISVLKGAGVRLFLPDALLLKGQSLLAQGQTDEAYDLMRQALAEAEDTGSRRCLWQVCGALGDLEDRRGDLDAGKEMRRRGRETADYIAAHTGDEALSSAFMAQPEVRTLYDD